MSALECIREDLLKLELKPAQVDAESRKFFVSMTTASPATATTRSAASSVACSPA